MPEGPAPQLAPSLPHAQSPFMSSGGQVLQSVRGPTDGPWVPR